MKNQQIYMLFKEQKDNVVFSLTNKNTDEFLRIVIELTIEKHMVTNYDMKEISKKIIHNFLDIDKTYQILDNKVLMNLIDNNDRYTLKIAFNGNENFTNLTVINVIEDLMKTPIQGKFNIDSVQKQKQTIKRFENGEYVEKQIFSIFVEGPSKLNILDFSIFPQININMSYQTNIFNLQSSVGICGTQHLIYKQLYNIFDNSGNQQFPQNIQLIAEIMCHKSYVTQIHRNKIDDLYNSNNLFNQGFEKTSKFLFNGALTEAKSNSDNILSSIMLNANFKQGYGKSKYGLFSEINKQEELMQFVLKKDEEQPLHIKSKVF